MRGANPFAFHYTPRDKKVKKVSVVIKITVERDGQTSEEFTCDQFYLIAGGDGKITERVFCEPLFLARVSLNMYRYSLKLVEEVINKKEAKKEQAVKAIEEVVN